MATSVKLPNTASFEKSLDAFLVQRGVDKKLVSNYAKSIAALQRSGIEIIDILDRGIPVPDWILVKARMPSGKVELLSEVLKVPKLRGIDIFPYGIINPELELNLKIGNFKG